MGTDTLEQGVDSIGSGGLNDGTCGTYNSSNFSIYIHSRRTAIKKGEEKS